MTTKIKIIMAALVIVILVAPALRNGPDKGRVTIGALYPLSGGLASYGEPAQKTAQVAMDEINNKGGIKGKQLMIEFQDHKCDPKTGLSLFKQLHDAEQINFFTSVGCSGTVLSIAPVLKDAVLVGSVITSPKISGSSTNLFRNYASDEHEAKLFAEEILKRGYKTIAVLYEETDYAKGLKLSLEKFLTGTNVTVVGESFATGAIDVRTQVTKIKAARADVVFISPQTVTSGDLVLGEMKKQKFAPALIVNENVLKAKDLLVRYPDLLENALSADYVVEKSDRLDSLLAKYKEKYGADCPQVNICATVYDNIYLLADAIAHVGTNPADVKNYLAKNTYDGVSGSISFDENNDRKAANYRLFTIKNGQAIAH